MEFHRSLSGGLNYYDFNLKLERGVSHCKFPAAYFQAPQFYYTDQADIKTRPRQMQAYLCGRGMFPMPMELPRFTRDQTVYSEFLRNAVLIGDVFVTKDKFGDIVKRATQDNAVGPRHKQQPSKPLYHQDYRMSAEQAMGRFDSKYNRSLSKRLSIARTASMSSER